MAERAAGSLRRAAPHVESAREADNCDAITQLRHGPKLERLHVAPKVVVRNVEERQVALVTDRDAARGELVRRTVPPHHHSRVVRNHVRVCQQPLVAVEVADGKGAAVTLSRQLVL